MQPYPRLFVSAARKSSGKTLLTLGLAAALREKGSAIRLYKKGPDYIDPMWHKLACGHDSFNLDPFLMGGQICRDIFLEHSQRFDLSIIEGNHGLHDGMDLEGGDSSAALAKLLAAPVILVVDSTGMNRNIAAIVFGLQNFDPEVMVKGVILNRVRSPRQETKQRQAIERYCGIPVLGSIPVLQERLIPERRLGLITPREETEPGAILSTLRDIVSEHVNLDQVREIAGQAPPLKAKIKRKKSRKRRTVTIAIAYDRAFCFYYRDNLDALENEGAELVVFDSLSDKVLPDADGVYIAGGFPESFLQELENNRPLRNDLAEKIAAGLPAYAECGGMMYLTRSIISHGRAHRMVGVIPADVQLQENPAGYGYVELCPRDASSWLKLDRAVKGHEFHYSKLVNADPRIQYFFEVKRGTGMGNKRDGIVFKNLLASFAHLHAQTVPEWSRSFVEFIRQRRAASSGATARRG